MAFNLLGSLLKEQNRLSSSLTRLIIHHADGFSLGQLQCCDPSLALHFCAGLQVVGATATAQHNVAGVLRVDVCCGQVDCATTRVGHLCLCPAIEHQKDTDRQTDTRKKVEHISLVHEPNVSAWLSQTGNNIFIIITKQFSSETAGIRLREGIGQLKFPMAISRGREARSYRLD